MQGTMDYTAYLVAKTALAFYSDQGGREALLRYTTPLLDWAQQMLCHTLNTTVLPVPDNMVAPFMRVLRSVENKILGKVVTYISNLKASFQ